MDRKEQNRYLENWWDERNSAYLYRTLSERETDPRLADVYRRLAATEEKHAATWEKYLLDAGEKVPDFQASWRSRTLAWLAGRFGVDFVLPTLSSLEEVNSHEYAGQTEAAGMVAAEKSHAILLQQMSRASHGKGVEGDVLAKIEGRHRSAGGNALRAAVLGASDGLLSNFNLVMGVAGAAVSSQGILLTGFAGLLAGAISMALGEWISVQSSRELYQRQIDTEREEIETSPEEEIEELALIYQARGLDEQAAQDLATHLMRNPETALDTLARDELGINPEDLGGSAWEAAITSFCLFAIGAILPVIPYLFLVGNIAIMISAIVSAIGLFGIGAASTLFTGRTILYSGMRQVSFGLAAAAITFFVGHFLGVSIGG
jgi:vacuolar iron transporter family protein